LFVLLTCSAPVFVAVHWLLLVFDGVYTATLAMKRMMDHAVKLPPLAINCNDQTWSLFLMSGCASRGELGVIQWKYCIL